MATVGELLGRREVIAPVAGKDWLTQDEILTILGTSETTLGRMIDAGQFPRAVPFAGGKRWRWVDVAWYYLHREVLDRLPELAPADDESPSKRRT